MLTLGIDEAGRGPCIGSMFIAGTLFEEKQLDKLKQMGIKDSKLLSHKKIIELSDKIKKIAKDIEVIEVTPKEIDEAIDGNNGLNLNWLEGNKIGEIINKLNPDKAIIDSPSPNLYKFKHFIKKQIKNKNIELIVVHKADRDFVECASASILAKCAREEHVLKIEKKVKQSIGSGYPSNPICKNFLKENHEKYPEIIRKSWAPYKTLIKESQQKSLDKF